MIEDAHFTLQLAKGRKRRTNDGDNEEESGWSVSNIMGMMIRQQQQ